MTFRRINLARHLAFPAATSKLVDTLTNVEGNETPNGIEIGAVLIPWHMVVLREVEPELPNLVPGNSPLTSAEFAALTPDQQKERLARGGDTMGNPCPLCGSMDRFKPPEGCTGGFHLVRVSKRRGRPPKAT